MIGTGVIRNISDRSGRIALNVLADDELVEDVTLIQIAGDESQVTVGDRVLLLQLAGPVGEFLALPWRQSDGVERQIIASVVTIAETVANAAALATLADLQAQVQWLQHQFDVTAGHTHPIIGGPPVTVGPNAGLPTVPPPTPAGTQKLVAE